MTAVRVCKPFGVQRGKLATKAEKSGGESKRHLHVIAHVLAIPA